MEDYRKNNFIACTELGRKILEMAASSEKTKEADSKEEASETPAK